MSAAPVGKRASIRKRTSARIVLSRGGLRLQYADGHDEALPLRAGACHYWRLDPSAWRAALVSLKSMELTLVETYVPWQVHEEGEERDASPRYVFDGARDVAAFLREAHAVGLKAIVRPGPHINAELTDFGLPERVVWNVECQARTPGQNPVMLPALPRAFPVPSYASAVFLREAARWFHAVGAELRDLVWPRGPIVLAQIDNEGAFYFRDGVYDQDYHPDAVAHYRAFLRRRYKTIGELRRAHRTDVASFDAVEPPLRYDVRSAEDLPRHLDWTESSETLLAEAFATMSESLASAGLAGVPFFHNLPMGEMATPLHPAVVRRSEAGRGRGLDLLALDYYHAAGDHRAIARRTSELAIVSDALDHPAFAAEMGAGAPPFFPPLGEHDAAFTVLCAMAYGVRGYNVYMAVERDRWLGSPIDRDGVLRPFAAFWTKLGAAFEHVGFGELRRVTPARLVVPRSIRRLARVMHAFGPVSQALFRVFGGGLRETVLEDEIDFGDGHGEAPPMRAGRMLVAAERALEEEGVPYAFVDGGDAPIGLADASWVFLPTSCGVDVSVIEAVRRAQERGARVTMAPAPPRRDGSFRPHPPKVLSAIPQTHVMLDDEATDSASIRAIVAPIFPPERRLLAFPSPCTVTVHLDATGAPRAVFLVNPTRTRERITSAVRGVKRVRDLLEGSVHTLTEGVITDPNTVRFCEVVE